MEEKSIIETSEDEYETRGLENYKNIFKECCSVLSDNIKCRQQVIYETDYCLKHTLRYDEEQIRKQLFSYLLDKAKKILVRELDTCENIFDITKVMDKKGYPKWNSR